MSGKRISRDELGSRNNPYATIAPTHADFNLYCCGTYTSYASSMEHSLAEEGGVLHCRICGRDYVPNIVIALSPSGDGIGKVGHVCETVKDAPPSPPETPEGGTEELPQPCPQSRRDTCPDYDEGGKCYETPDLCRHVDSINEMIADIKKKKLVTK